VSRSKHTNRLRRDVREANIRANTEAEELESYPGFEPDLKKQEIADLREDLREAERIAEDFDDLQSRLADIKAEIRQAKSDDQVENALAERDRALDDLKDQLEGRLCCDGRRRTGGSCSGGDDGDSADRTFSSVLVKS